MAQYRIYILMEKDCYPRFLRSAAYRNLVNQLAAKRSKKAPTTRTPCEEDKPKWGRFRRSCSSEDGSSDEKGPVWILRRLFVAVGESPEMKLDGCRLWIAGLHSKTPLVKKNPPVEGTTVSAQLNFTEVCIGQWEHSILETENNCMLWSYMNEVF